MKKNNIDILRDILTEFKKVDSVKAGESLEFLDSIQEEMDSKSDEVTRLEEEVTSKQSEIEELEEAKMDGNEIDLCIDTLRWELKDGNLILQERIENFIRVLKRDYVGVTA